MAITIASASNPRWADVRHTRIELSVRFSHLPDTVEFCAAADDVEAHGRALFARAAAGEFGTPADYEAPPPVRRLVPKSLIIARLTDQQIAAGAALLDQPANARLRARWYAADRPGVYADDADSRLMFQAIGADPDAVLAP